MDRCGKPASQNTIYADHFIVGYLLIHFWYEPCDLCKYSSERWTCISSRAGTLPATEVYSLLWHQSAGLHCLACSIDWLSLLHFHVAAFIWQERCMNTSMLGLSSSLSSSLPVNSWWWLYSTHHANTEGDIRIAFHCHPWCAFEDSTLNSIDLITLEHIEQIKTWSWSI